MTKIDVRVSRPFEGGLPSPVDHQDAWESEDGIHVLFERPPILLHMLEMEEAVGDVYQLVRTETPCRSEDNPNEIVFPRIDLTPTASPTISANNLAFDLEVAFDRIDEIAERLGITF